MVRIVFPCFVAFLVESLLGGWFAHRGWYGFCVVAVLNVMTDPAVTCLAYILPKAGLHPWVCTVALVGTSILIEWAFYQAFLDLMGHPFLFSLALNGCAVAAGLAAWAACPFLI